MNGILSYYTFRIILFTYTFHICTSIIPDKVISVTEIGYRVPGDEVTLAIQGYVPAFYQSFKKTIMPARTDVSTRFTFLRVEYDSPLSTVDITYDADMSELHFEVQFPFLDIPFGVIGYSLKIKEPTQTKNHTVTRAYANVSNKNIFRQYGLTQWLMGLLW